MPAELGPLCTPQHSVPSPFSREHTDVADDRTAGHTWRALFPRPYAGVGTLWVEAGARARQRSGVVDGHCRAPTLLRRGCCVSPQPGVLREHLSRRPPQLWPTLVQDDHWGSALGAPW
jgi:hypothetical protein